MKKRRFISGLTALSVTAGMLGIMPALTTETYAAEIVKNDFEINYDGWYAENNETTITAVEGAGFGGSRGMVLSDRASSADSIASAKGFYLWGGVDYDYSIQVSSQTDEHFTMTLTYALEKDGAEEETTVVLDDQFVPAGQWAKLGGTFKAPKGAYEFRVTVSTDSTNDFTIDDLLITSKKAKNTANAAPAGKGLKDEFANYFLCGNILNGNTVNDSAICANIIKDCNVIECENETKPDATIVQSGSTDTNVKVAFGKGASAIMDLCIRNNIGFRGHTLVWHSQTPSWFFKQNFNDSGAYVSTSVMDQRMESYIKNMFNAYATQYSSLNLVAYDVCNEVVYDGTANNGGARPKEGRDSSNWVMVYGDNSFVEKAFTYARKYAPSTCKLFYNDYNEFSTDKQRCIINTILQPLHDKGLLDGMGMQSHVNAAASNAWGDTVSYLAAMDKYLALGIEVQVTELDITRDSYAYSDADQAAKYKAIYQHCVDVNSSGKYPGRVTLVQVWGPNDNNSWVGGAGKEPLLYDGNNQPKSAYTAITSIIPDDQWGDGSNPGSFEVTPIEPDENGYYFHHTFEGTDNGWESRGGTTIQTSGRTFYEGAEALLVSERTASWNGAAYSISANPFKPGEEFSFSACVNYFDGAETTDFKFTLQYTGSDGEPHYDQIAAGTGIKGQWVQLSNTNYKIPEDATSMMIYLETSDDTTENFYIDDVYGAVAGTVIPGPGAPKVRTMIPGDIDGDERITVFDVIAGRDGLINGFSDNIAARCADVDQSGKYEINDLVLIQQFVLRKITEFPIVEPEYDQVDVSKMQSTFSSVTPAASWKSDGENNPMTTQRFGADPGWMVYDGRLYIYTTDDQYEYFSDGRLKVNTYNSGTINCVSTADMVNWTDHGALPIAGQNGRTTNGCAKWASAAWAPDACWKMIDGKPKFYLFFANSGGGIGVVTADSPTGPWTDANGGALLTHNSPNCSDVEWMFDPGVYYDETTDEAYLFFGGGRKNGVAAATPGTGRVVKLDLGKDKVTLAGDPVKMDIPYLFEDSSVIKIGDTWYYSYCSNWDVGNQTVNGVNFGNADILYMTSKDPLSWNSSNLAGNVFKNTGSQRIDNGGNNHHSIIYFKDKYYVAYHSRQKAMREFKEKGLTAYESNGNTNTSDGNYRSTQINEASFSNGKITCSGDMKGCTQIEPLDPFTKVQAETMSNQSKGIVVNGLYDTTVTGKKGDWIKVSGADLKDGIKAVTVKGSGGSVKICTGSPTGTVLGYAELGSSSQEVTYAATGSATGSKDIYIVFGSDNITLDYWYFS
ncbi:MAG: endo-1,4-beta-xylanase [Ruminococcus sp.]|nr:endo-1,4-beta-xylanase [Ruminococcus sp.]